MAVCKNGLDFAVKSVIVLGLLACLVLMKNYFKDPEFAMNVFKNTGFNTTRDRLVQNGEVDTLAPCGDVCNYTGKIIANKGNTFYQEITKEFECNNIMRRMAYKKHKITLPPPKNIPTDLRNDFLQNGKVKAGKPWYFSDIMKYNKVKHVYEKNQIENMSEISSQGDITPSKKVHYYYDRACLNAVMKKHTDGIHGLSGVVIGTQQPWLESLLLAYKARHVTTLEYSEVIFNHPQITVFNPYSYAEKYLHENAVLFEFGATFSSLEHSGLGRYGDPINPFGDLEAMAQIWCMMKPGGMLFLGIPGNLKGGSSIQWNAHRIYGPSRIQFLTANWELIDSKKCKDEHVVLVLKKRGV